MKEIEIETARPAFIIRCARPKMPRLASSQRYINYRNCLGFKQNQKEVNLTTLGMNGKDAVQVEVGKKGNCYGVCMARDRCQFFNSSRTVRKPSIKVTRKSR